MPKGVVSGCADRTPQAGPEQGDALGSNRSNGADRWGGTMGGCRVWRARPSLRSRSPGTDAGFTAPRLSLWSQDNLEKTAASIRGDFWLTGDRAIQEEDGYFQFLGRADEIINSSG